MPIHKQRKFDLPDVAVGEVLWAARTCRGLDLRDAAEKAGLDWRVLSRIERGERPCRVTELHAMAGAYNFAPHFLDRAVAGDGTARRRLNLNAPVGAGSA